MKRILCIALAALTLALPGLILSGGCSAPEVAVEAKAAIVDQLYVLKPNQAFIDKATQILEACGFKVDCYHGDEIGDEITVDFYRRLPTYGYKLIIFRAHSGLLRSRQGEVIPRTCLFTNELYEETRHVTEQLTDRLAMARINENYPWVFGIGAEFVNQSMQGRFDHTAIIMMGCSCLYIEDLARSFVDKGASIYTGWDASVGLDYVDKATITLVEKLCSEKVSMEAAVAETMHKEGSDPNYGAVLKYYPSDKGGWTIADLIR